VAWAAATYVCAKRLVPFLPDLVASLERHSHLTLSAEVRAQLLTLSAATADRLLRPAREHTRPRGIGTVLLERVGGFCISPQKGALQGHWTMARV